jgi:hypothetical protein
LDGIIKVLEAGHKALGLLGFGPAVEVIGAEVLVEGAVGEHVVGAGEDGCGDGADGFFGAAPGAQANGIASGDSCPFGERRPRHIGPGVVLSQGGVLGQDRMDNLLRAHS